MKGNLIDWSNLDTDADKGYAKQGELHFVLPKDGYYKLTIKSSDTKVLKLGKAKVVYDEDSVVTTVGYENLMPGVAYVTVTAADEAKSSISFRAEWEDAAPKLQNNKITVDQALSDNSAEIILYAGAEYNIGTAEVQFAGTNADKFQIADCQTAADENNTRIRIRIKPEDATKKGKYKAELIIPMKKGMDTSEEMDKYSVKLEITVVNNAPAVTLKQTKKVNLFYTDEERNGVLNLTSAKEITNLELTGCDYILTKTAENEYGIQLRTGTNGKNVNGILRYTVDGYRNTYTTKFKVGTENKAPSVVLSAKEDTLYPGINRDYSELVFTDKLTGERLELSKIVAVVGKQEYEVSEQQSTIAIGKNTYQIRLAGEGQEQSLQFVLLSEKSNKDSITLYIQEENWSKPLKVGYKMNVVLKNPTVQLSQKKLVLNRNEEVFAGEVVTTTLRWKGNNVPVDPGTAVRFEAKNTASQQVLNQSLVLEYWAEKGIIVARLNDNELKTGSYKYKVWVDKISTDLEISIVDKGTVKCVSLQKNGGSIDVLQRENTALKYKVKLSNLAGTVQDVYLRGADGDLFEAKMNDKGQLLISARKWAGLSTKASYRVQPVLIVQSEYGSSREIAAPVQTIKVKQGKPKLTVMAGESTFYKQRNNSITVSMKAVLNGQQVEIDNVSLISDTDKFELIETEAGNTFNKENGCITIKLADNDSIGSVYGQGSKSWKLSFLVRYTDKAGNESEQKVTCSFATK